MTLRLLYEGLFIVLQKLKELNILCNKLHTFTMTVVYLISSRLGSKTYVGSSDNYTNRIKTHKCGDTSNSHILLEEYGADNLIFTVLEECRFCDRDECEQYWIDFIPNTVNKKVCIYSKPKISPPKIARSKKISSPKWTSGTYSDFLKSINALE
jgi:hypothetical protein